jgi:hypothetical protein
MFIGANAIAYFSQNAGEEEKSFIALAEGQ